MEGTTHALSAGAAGAVTATLAFPHAPLAARLFFAGVTFAAGLAPDIDQPGSRIARSWGWVTETLAAVVHKVAGGHRAGTHELPGEAFAAGLAALCAAMIGDRWAQVVLGVMVAILAASALEVFRVHVLTADLAGAAAGIAVVTTRYELHLIPWAILLGMIVHVAGDSLTKDGTTPFRPLYRGTIRLLPKPLCITTGDDAEGVYRFVFALGLVAALAWDTGLAHLLITSYHAGHFALHAHLTGRIAP